MAQQDHWPLSEDPISLVFVMFLAREAQNLRDDLVSAARMNGGQLDPGLVPVDKCDPVRRITGRLDHVDRSTGDDGELSLKRFRDAGLHLPQPERVVICIY